MKCKGKSEPRRSENPISCFDEASGAELPIALTNDAGFALLVEKTAGSLPHDASDYCIF
jgi:hypothetical protein